MAGILACGPDSVSHYVTPDWPTRTENGMVWCRCRCGVDFWAVLPVGKDAT